ncbi:hypothetical protein KR026_006539 [Drosophila bipectinata]|nr:hypothetical protein KR026_006539 [Drosophila bipectinata]
MHESPGVKAGRLAGVTAGSGNGLPPYSYKVLPQEDKKPGNGAPLVGILKNGSATPSQPGTPTALSKNGDIATRIVEEEEEEEDVEVIVEPASEKITEKEDPPKEGPQREEKAAESPEQPSADTTDASAEGNAPKEPEAKAEPVATQNGQSSPSEKAGEEVPSLPVSRGPKFHEPNENLIRMAPLVTISETDLHELS